jgi:hypothetical protein
MDEPGIDRWARRLGRDVPRRRALAAMGAGLLLGVGANAEDTRGRKKKKRKKTCPVCRTGEDFCAGFGTPPCGKGCRCLTRLLGGTRCAVFGMKIQCHDCTKDAQCALFGKGAFCADGSGPNCCDAPGAGFCVSTCKP